MNRIDQDIKSKQLNNLYLLYGSENYLKNQYASRLIEAAGVDKNSMNYNYYEDDININSVIETANTLPFFADLRVIYIKNSGYFKSASDELNDYLSAVTESTIMIFVEDKIDKRSKSYKTLSKSGVAIELSMPSSNDIRTWIGGRLNSEGKSMEREAYDEFIIRTDGSMDNMDKEFDKLVSYAGDNATITLDDVRHICVKQLKSQIFDMIGAIAKKDTKMVLDMYHDLLAAKEPPVKILILIERQFQRSLKIKTLREQGYSNDRIAKDLGLSSFIIEKELRMTQNFSIPMMNQLLEEAISLERDIKTGRIQDILAVETLMIKYAQ